MIKDFYICPHCSKQYKTKKPYNHHVLICNIIKKNNNREIDIEEKISLDKIPSTYQLYELIIDLNKKYEKLEKDYNSIKQYINRRNKNINITDWLNKKLTSDNNFEYYFNNIIITNNELEIMYKNNYINGIVSIIINFINNIQYKQHLPIYAFNEKNQNIYIYTLNSNRVCENQWITINNSNMQNLLDILNSKLLKSLEEWHISIKDTYKNEDKLNELYINNLRCITSGSINEMSSIEKCNKIINKLYNNIKQDFQTFKETF